MLQLHDARGRFRLPDQQTIDALEPAERERFAPVLAAFNALHDTEAREKVARDGALVQCGCDRGGIEVEPVADSV